MKVLEEVAYELDDAVNNGIEVIDEVTGEKKIIKMPVDKRCFDYSPRLSSN